MSSWSATPPTYKEWRDVNNHGFWWIKHILCAAIEDEDGTSWPETWFTEIVTIACSYEDGKLFEGNGKLHARGCVLDNFDLDDKVRTKDMYWQPVVRPLDDIKDERPE